MDPTRRLLFWLRVPYAADIAMLLLGMWMLLVGNTVGWWVIVFALVRAAVGTIALVYVAPRIIARQGARQSARPR
jgi:hypothetical protein